MADIQDPFAIEEEQQARYPSVPPTVKEPPPGGWPPLENPFAVEEAQQARYPSKPYVKDWISSTLNTMGLQATAIWQALYDHVIKPGWEKLKADYSKLDQENVEAVDQLLREMVDAGWLNKGAAEYLSSVRNLPIPISSLAFLGVCLTLVMTNLRTLLDASGAELRQRLNAQFTPNLPDAAAMIQAAFIAPEKTTEVRDILKRQGFKDEHADLMFIANYRLYDVTTAMQLYFRGLLDRDGVFERLGEMGFTDQRIIEIMDTWKIIPPVQDIIRFAVREAFTPEIAEKFGQYEDFPEEFGAWAKKQGLSEEWSKRYWAAHWELPSVQMGYEMLHRGVINRDELDLLMRAQDIMPFWREKLKAISYAPYTRVDVRRMHDVGVLTDADLVKSYKDIGYDDEHASKMAEYTIALNRDNDKKLTQSQVIKAYRASIITKDDARNLLKPLKYGTDQIDYFLAMADFEETLEVQSIYVSSTGERYVDGLWDEMQTRNALAKLNLPGVRIDALMDKWKVKRKVDYKLPSKTDLDKMLTSKIINEDVYKTEMYRLGYSFQYTDWYLQLIKAKK